MLPPAQDKVIRHVATNSPAPSAMQWHQKVRFNLAMFSPAVAMLHSANTWHYHSEFKDRLAMPHAGLRCKSCRVRLPSSNSKQRLQAVFVSFKSTGGWILLAGITGVSSIRMATAHPVSSHGLDNGGLMETTALTVSAGLQEGNEPSREALALDPQKTASVDLSLRVSTHATTQAATLLHLWQASYHSNRDSSLKTAALASFSPAS